MRINSKRNNYRSHPIPNQLQCCTNPIPKQFPIWRRLVHPCSISQVEKGSGAGWLESCRPAGWMSVGCAANTFDLFHVIHGWWYHWKIYQNLVTSCNWKRKPVALFLSLPTSSHVRHRSERWRLSWGGRIKVKVKLLWTGAVRCWQNALAYQWSYQLKNSEKNHMFAVLDKCGVLTLNVQAGHCCRQFGHKDHGYTRAQAIDVCKHFHTQQSCRVRLLWHVVNRFCWKLAWCHWFCLPSALRIGWNTHVIKLYGWAHICTLIFEDIRRHFPCPGSTP